MKVTITESGVLYVQAETGLDSYALRKWKLENVEGDDEDCNVKIEYSLQKAGRIVQIIPDEEED
jgi:hypothetical protein